MFRPIYQMIKTADGRALSVVELHVRPVSARPAMRAEAEATLARHVEADASVVAYTVVRWLR